MRRSDGVRLALLLTVLRPVLPGGGAAGAQAISQGFELERQGRAEQAAALYKTVLRGDPANIPALLGLERVLPSLGRLGDLLPLVQQALVSDTGGAVRGLAVRTFTALQEDDSVAALVRRWSAAHPGDASAWREWAIALEDHQRFEDARTDALPAQRCHGLPHDGVAHQKPKAPQRRTHLHGAGQLPALAEVGPAFYQRTDLRLSHPVSKEAMSRSLVDRGIDHTIIERGRVAERWRSERWDSLRLLTPNWQSRHTVDRYSDYHSRA